MSELRRCHPADRVDHEAGADRPEVLTLQITGSRSAGRPMWKGHWPDYPFLGFAAGYKPVASSYLAQIWWLAFFALFRPPFPPTKNAAAGGTTWTPPAVGRLRHVLPFTGSSVPGPFVARPELWSQSIFRNDPRRPQQAVASRPFRRSFRIRHMPRAAPTPATNTICVGSGTT